MTIISNSYLNVTYSQAKYHNHKSYNKNHTILGSTLICVIANTCIKVSQGTQPTMWRSTNYSKSLLNTPNF